MESPRAGAHRTRWTVYAVAVAAIVATLLASLAMSSWFGDRPVLVLFVIPILLVSYAGGLGPGLFTTVLAAVGTVYYLIPPTHSLAIGRPVDVAQWLILILVGVLISFLNAQLQRARSTRAEADLERFFTLSLDFLCIASGDGYFKRVSPAVTEILGWSVEEFLATPYMQLVHPDDQPATLREVEKQMRSGERVLHFENRYRHKDGSWRVLSWRSMPQPDGLMYATARDVTQLKEVEKALLDTNEQLEQRVQVRTAELQAQLRRLNLLSQITRAIGERQDTRSIFQVVVRTLEAELPLDLACIGLYDADRNELTVASVGQASAGLAMELAMTEHAGIAIDQNGLSRCVRGQLVYEPDLSQVRFPFPVKLHGCGLQSLVAAPLLVESNVFGILIAARREANAFASGDCEFLKQLSEHVALAAHQAQLQGALQTAYDELRQTQQAVLQQERLRALGQMASGIAHDINNAISPIAIYTELLLERESGLSASAREYLETTRRAIHDVAQTVSRLREFYRQREPEANLAPVNLNALAPQVIDLTRARWGDMANQRGVAIDVRSELGADLPSIMGAESELRDALTNLIFNAVDALPHGGSLTVRTFVERDSPPRVSLEVSDTGIGMDEATRRRCLEPFFTTKGERGTGLGLPMVYGVAQRHSADIEIESVEGKGTTVRLTFAIPTAPAGVAQPDDEPIRPQQLRILIVDDDPVLLKSLCDILEADGHALTASHGGQAGIDAFRSARERSESFDIVITDLGMPYVDGRKVASTLKSLAPDLPVILLTGWGERLAAEGDIPPHVDRVLSKPPKLRDLRAALAMLTRTSAQR